MTLQALKSVCESVALLALAGSAIFFAADTHSTQVRLRGDMAAAETSLDRLNAILTEVNRPCSPGPCGTLAELNKTAVKIQDIAVTTQLQVAQSSILVNAASRSLTDVASHLDASADSFTATGTAAVATLGQARADLQTANGSIAALQPLLTHSDSAVTDFDALLTNPAIPETLTNAEHITWNANEITFDAKRVADDATRKYFTPQPWWRKAFPFLTTGAKIASYALPW